MPAVDTFWLSCLEYFEKELSAQQFNTWIKPLSLESSHNAFEPVLVAPNRFVMQWVKDNFVARIEQMAQEYFSCNVHFQLKLADQGTTKPGEPMAKSSLSAQNHASATFDTSPVGAQKTRDPKEKHEKNPSRLNPAFTFNSFVTGKANQLARAGAIQVAERPGVAYNPFFIYGGVGLGKTHLIQAIGNLVLEHNSAA
ncbi:MAG TPA: DnaA/Hda family protein, partial [Nitrosospira sp.]|nr:DnaA/Hda family protein [Nitrosospira sp.]